VLVSYCGCRQVKIESPRQRISSDEGIRLWGAKMSSVFRGLTPEPFGSALNLLGAHPTAMATTLCLTIRAACGHWSPTDDLLLLRQVVGARFVYWHTSSDPSWQSLSSWLIRRIPHF